MINFRILSMTTIATNMLISNILKVLTNMISSILAENMLSQQIGSRNTYRSVVEEVAVAVAVAVPMLLTTTLAMTGRRRHR